MTKAITNMGPSADVGVMSVAMSMAQTADSEKGRDPERPPLYQVDQTAQVSHHDQVRLHEHHSSAHILTV